MSHRPDIGTRKTEKPVVIAGNEARARDCYVLIQVTMNCSRACDCYV